MLSPVPELLLCSQWQVCLKLVAAFVVFRTNTRGALQSSALGVIKGGNRSRSNVRRKRILRAAQSPSFSSAVGRQADVLHLHLIVQPC